MKKGLFLFLLAIITLLGFEIKATSDVNVCPNAKSAILFEGKTNTLLYDQNMDLRLPPASMTKIMTLLLIYEALEDNVITKDTIVVVSENAKSMEGSKAFLSVGEKINVDELIKCICIASANDAAVAIAEAISGSEASFVDKMNEKVSEFGLQNTHFSDCTGLSSKNHYTSAYDLAIISDYLLDNYPEVLQYTSMKEDYIRKDTNSPFWLVNTNKLLGHVDGIDGLKTGYTSFSGYGITLHMDKNNMSLISVVMGYKDSKIRNGESVKLLHYGANNYEIKTIYHKNDIIKNIDSIHYKNNYNITLNNDVCYLIKKGEEVNYDVKLVYDMNDGFNGYVELYVNNKLSSKTNVSLDKELERRNNFEVALELFKLIFCG